MNNETKAIDESLEKWKGKTEELAENLSAAGKLATGFTICGCRGTVVTTADGKKHLELECKSKADREQVAAIFEEEVVLRVNPKVILVDTQEAAAVPGVEPQVEPVTEPRIGPFPV
ncbi:hypothetical protein ES705_43921 [subsurface metagenome]